MPKLTIPSPSMAHFRADISGSGYADKDEFRADLAAAYAAEIAALPPWAAATSSSTTPCSRS